MPDISMCLGKACKKKNQCFRAMAKPDKFQSYGCFEEDCKTHEYRNRISMAGLGSELWVDSKRF